MSLVYINQFLGMEAPYYIDDAALLEEKIICSWNCSNKLLVFEPKNEQIYLVEIGEKEEKYQQIGVLEEGLALSARRSREL